MALQRWHVVVALMLAIGASSVPDDDNLVQTLDDRHQHALDDRSGAFVDIAGGSTAGTGVMTEAMTMQTRHDLVRMAGEFKTPSLQMDGLATSELAEKVLLQEKQGGGSKGSGLDLIFRKLDELEKKIKNEETSEAAVNQEEMDSCGDEITKLNNLISETSNKRKENGLSIRQASASTEEQRAGWVASRALEHSTHESLVDMQNQRAEETEAIAARVNERNKAIDVMVKATFMVCEKFPRYKDTPQCMEIKSQPDVDEPQRYKTDVPDKAQKETIELHAKDSEWDVDWQKQIEKDMELEGNPDPEGNKGGMSAQEEAAADTPTPAPTEPAEKMLQHKAEDSLRKAASDAATVLIQIDADEEHHTGLSSQEKLSIQALKKLAGTKGLARKYSVPLVELAESLKQGETKRSKSIVQILIEVLNETRNAQAADKASHNANLLEYYKQSWDMWDVMHSNDIKQVEMRRVMEVNRHHILQLDARNEETRQSQEAGQAARTQEEDRCSAITEAYGIRASKRSEDLENLVKLKSMLRSLYFKRFPKSCPRDPSKRVCAGSDRGMCSFTERTEGSNEQRCSCTVGYYGDACQYVMCPGHAKNLYKANAEGVCSGRGSCDTETGLCHCGSEFFHGPKKACDYKYAPPSKHDACEPHCDNQCSGRGNFDPIRGVCNCRNEFFGPGCEEKKCPNSNGVLYPRASGNSCNGRGPCDIDTGKCGCPVVKEGCTSCGANECGDRAKCGAPYFGQSCEFERCPNDCSSRGACNNQDGSCACTNDEAGNPYFGPSCEFKSCPSGCSGGGECDRTNGKCVCKDGYSGIKCENTKQCTAKNLVNNEMNWWTIWDKPGWMVCPKGQLMHGLKRSTCEALSCIDSGECGAACEGDNHVFQLRHCYHDIRWYNTFDTAGVSTCLDDYFVAGLFRSCESLYCLNMAKCCSLKEARWTQCSWSNWAVFNGPSTARVKEAQFIVGFKRSEGHQLKNIDEAKGCRFVRGY